MAGMVKEAVTVSEVAKALGLNVNMHNRCSCPFHNGKDRNMSVKGDMYHCFVCHASGDLFELVRGVTGMPFIDALKWANTAFNLEMDIDSSKDDKRLKSAKKRLKRKAEDRAFRERIEQLDYDMLMAVQTALDRMEQQRDDNRPRRYSEEWNKAFCDAVNVIPELKSATEYFTMESTVIRK